MIAKHKWQIATISVLEAVFAERIYQVAKHGHNLETEDGTGPDVCWLGDWIDPAGAHTAEQIEQHFRTDYESHEEVVGPVTWMHLVREELAESFTETDPVRLEAELLQVAALCVSWVEKIRSRTAPQSRTPNEKRAFSEAWDARVEAGRRSSSPSD